MGEGKVKPGLKHVRTHMIFDINMDGKFTCKDRIVAGSHNMAHSSSITYSSVTTRESFRLVFIIADLNYLDICACDIGNTYLNDPYWGKLWTKAVFEFGSDKGYVFIVISALYGLKSSWASWGAKLSDTLTYMGYRSNESDPDV